MLKKNSLLVYVIVAVSGLTFASCATKAVGVQQDSSFKKDSIVSGKMAVGGVVSSTEVSDAELTSFASSLKNQIKDNRKDYSVSPSGAVSDKVGSGQYKSMLAEYKETGVLGGENLKKLSASMKGIRYIVFARIDSDTIDKKKEHQTEKGKDGKVASSSVVSRVSRKVSVSFNVYDTERGISAWSGSLETSKNKSKEYKVGTNFVDIITSVKVGGDKGLELYPYPKTPDMKKILAKNFKGFAKQMPK